MRVDLPVILTVEDRGRTWTVLFFGESPLTIGRSASCTIALEAPKASRRHAEIRAEDDEVFLVDCGSSNGTWLNGERVEHHALHPGDVIQVGRSRIVFGEAASDATPAVTIPAPPVKREESRARRRGKPPRAVIVLNLVMPVILLGFLAGLIAWVLSEPTPEAVETPRPSIADEGEPDAGAPGRSALDPARIAEEEPPVPGVESAPSAVPPSPTAGSDPVPRSIGAEAVSRPAGVEWESLLTELEAQRIGWDVFERFDEIRASASDPETIGAAHRWSAALAGLRQAVAASERERADSLVSALIRNERFADALAVTAFLTEMSRETETAEYWRERERRLEVHVRNALAEFEIQMGKCFETGRADEALRSLVDLRSRYGGTAPFEALLPRYIAAFQQARPRAPHFPADRSARWEEAAAIARAECRFRDVTACQYRILSLDPPRPVRLRTLAGLVESFYLERMFTCFLGAAQGQVIDVSLAEAEHYQDGRVVRADAREVTSEYELNGHTVARTEPWRRVAPLKKIALFSAVNLDPEALLGLAYFCFRHGYEEGGHRALIRLHRQKDSRELAAAFLSQRRGVPLPSEGFVVHRGRLVTPSEKELEIAERERAREMERARLRELRELERSDKVGTAVDFAVEQRQAGQFELAQRLLEEISNRERLAGTEGGARARRVLRDVLLAHRRLSESGSSANRVDVVILGEGFPVEDEAQERFLAYAESCRGLLLNEEPYREYQSYLNFHAVQLGSRDAGVDGRGRVRDTALDGKVEWDVFSVNPERVMELLGRLDDAGRDKVAIVIGNDYAGVQTGGGGIACLSKGGLSAVGHELGHAMAGLRDEYDNPPGNDPQRRIAKERRPDVSTRPLYPNLMRGSDREDVRAHALWRDWIEAGEKAWWNGAAVGVFEGGGHTPFNVWRAQANCKMRHVAVNFCVVCMERMVLSVYRHVRPIDRIEPQDDTVILDADLQAVFRVWPLRPETHFLEATWTLQPLPAKPESAGEGPTVVRDAGKAQVYRRVFRTFDPEGRVVEIAQLGGRDLHRGSRYRLQVVVRDPTPWVLQDPEELLIDRREWTIEVR